MPPPTRLVTLDEARATAEREAIAQALKLTIYLGLLGLENP